MFDTSFELGIIFVLSVVVGGTLPDGIRRISDDNFNASVLLFVDAFGILLQDAFERQILLTEFVKLKSVGETNSVERSVTFGVQSGVISVFDVDCGDVIGEQDNFVGVQFVQVLVEQIFRTNQAGLNQSRDKSARARERVDNVNVFVGEPAIEMFF